MSKTMELIKQDHRKVEELFAQFRANGDPDIAEQICTELTVHTKFEEELVYPILKKEGDEEDAQHAQEEHDEAKQIILQIQGGDATGDELMQLVAKLEKAISHHVQEEESKILPEMEEKSAKEMEAIFDDVVARKQELIEQEESDPELLELARAEMKARVDALNNPED
jgi:hemerythrin superfamily protein